MSYIRSIKGDIRKYTQGLFDSYQSRLEINDERQRHLGEREIEKQLEKIRVIVDAHLGEERAKQILDSHKRLEEAHKNNTEK